MRSLTALGLILGPAPTHVAIDTETDIAGAIRLERQGVSPVNLSMGAMVPAPEPCNCDECKPMRQYLQQEVDAVRLTMSSPPPEVGTMLRLSGATNQRENGTFTVVKSPLRGKSLLGSGMFSPFATPNQWAPTAPLSQELYDAHKTARRRSVRPGRKKDSKNFRILDHGTNWKDQRCQSRFKIVRWIGPNPAEWEKVGWNVGPARFANRREAAQAKRDLIAVAEVMES